jgi:hypothetical protein
LVWDLLTTTKFLEIRAVATYSKLQGPYRKPGCRGETTFAAFAIAVIRGEFARKINLPSLLRLGDFAEESRNLVKSGLLNYAIPSAAYDEFIVDTLLKQGQSYFY